MSLSFRYKRFRYKNRIIWRPYARVTIRCGAVSILTEMLIDSGADISMIPKREGEILGFGVRNNEKRERLSGIGGHAPVFYRRLNLTIGRHSHPVRVAWILSDEIPPLLGRMDIFTRFDILFQENFKRTRFRAVST